MPRAPALAMLLALSGCATDPADVPLGGTWTGSADTSDGTLSFVWKIRESEGVIVGSASMTLDAVTFAGDVSGSYIHPDVRMTLVITFTGDDYEYRWVGTRTGDDMLSGVFHNVGVGSTELDLTREEGD